MVKYNREVHYWSDLSGSEPEFYMHLDYGGVTEMLLSIAHRRLSNRGSGMIRHLGDGEWTRIVNGREIKSAYEENKKDARIFHDSYDEHIKVLRLRERGNEFVVISNGNLGNNLWHVAWQHDKTEKGDKRLYCLGDEPFTDADRNYSCFVVPRDKTKRPDIRKVRFNELEDILDENGKDICEEVDWGTFGQLIVENGNVVLIEKTLEQFYDVRHIFDLRDWYKKRDKEGRKRMKSDMKIIKELYKGYPDKFKDKMLEKLREDFPRGRHYQATLGLDEKGVVIYHYKGTIEEVGERLVDKGVKNAIVLDQGGSVGVYASWLDGFLTRSSYFRPERISAIGFVLK